MKSYSEQIRSRGENNDEMDTKPKYVSSQYIMETSLSKDISYLSSLYNTQQMNDNQVTTNTTYENIKPHTEESEKPKSEEKDIEITISEQELELDDINKNPCMQSLLRLVDHIHAQFSHTYKSGQMPEWMKFMHNVFCDGEAHNNVLVFMGKLIINRPNIFEPYANEWLEPLITLALTPSISKEFNYYFRDLCITLLLRWNITPSGPSQEHLATQLFNQIIKNIIYPSRFITKCNIEIAKLFVEKWKGNFIPNKKLILDMISFDEKRSGSRMYRVAGLQVLGILVANGLPFYDNVNDKAISQAQLSTFVSRNLIHSFKEVYCTAAEVCGLIFKSEGTTGDLGQLVKESINRAYANNESERFLFYLDGISRHYPEFLDSFFVKIFSLLPKLVGPHRVLA